MQDKCVMCGEVVPEPAMRGKLIALIDQDQCPDPYSCSKDCKYVKLPNCHSARIADHLLDNGVIVLPCKVGDVVYTNINGTGLQNSFRITEVDLLGFSNGIYSWTWHQLGKSVFLSIEEAEQALKEGLDE